MAKKVIKDLLKKAMSNGDKSSAAQSGTSTKKKTAMDAVKEVGKYVSTFGGATERDNPKQKDINIVKKLKETGSMVKSKLGLKKGGAVSSMLPKTNVLKNALSKGDKSSAAQAFKSMVAKKAKPNTVKIDSTKKVTPIGGSKPSVMIKKETKIKDVKPITKEFRKKMQVWDKLPKVEYKPLPKK
jgi:hypothetical protein